MKESLFKIASTIASDRLVLSDSWITNGHWAIKKDLVFNGKKLNSESVSIFYSRCLATEMTDAQMSKAIPCDPDLTEKYDMSQI